MGEGAGPRRAWARYIIAAKENGDSRADNGERDDVFELETTINDVGAAAKFLEGQRLMRLKFSLNCYQANRHKP